jgi:hypothetical protein
MAALEGTPLRGVCPGCVTCRIADHAGWVATIRPGHHSVAALTTSLIRKRGELTLRCRPGLGAARMRRVTAGRRSINDADHALAREEWMMASTAFC